MPDFTVVVASGAQVQDWLDPSAADGRRSRLNPRAGYNMKRLVGALGTPVVLAAVVGGVTAPPDAALGGRLFVAWAVEAPWVPFAGLAAVPGFTSLQVVTPNARGHYTIGIRRPDGGLEHVHLDIG